MRAVVLASVFSVLSLGCKADSANPDNPTAQAEQAGFGHMPDWFMTEEWGYISQCNAQAMLAYFLVADRRRDKTMDEQLTAFKQMDRATEEPQFIPVVTEMLRETYGRSDEELLEYPPHIAAQCLSSLAVIHVDYAQGLACFNKFRRPSFEASLLNIGRMPSQASFLEPDEQLYSCLLGS